MSNFTCNDCVKFGTDACVYGVNCRFEFSDVANCDEILVEHNHAYNKAIDDFKKEVCEIFPAYHHKCFYKIAERLKGDRYE